MLIKKGEILSLSYGFHDKRAAPMIALKDFDLKAVANELIKEEDDDIRAICSFGLHEDLVTHGYVAKLPHHDYRIVTDGVAGVDFEAIKD